jgi:predicted RNase H-like HicB family nuclease
MTLEEAVELFEEWYEKCLEAGIEPEEAVANVGGMALITDEELVERLEDSGDITSY